MQKKKEAAAFFRKSVEADPTFPKSHLYLGICLGAEGNPDEAARQFEDFLHLAPTDPNAPAVIPILRDYLKKAPNFKLRWPLPPPPP